MEKFIPTERPRQKELTLAAVEAGSRVFFAFLVISTAVYELVRAFNPYLPSLPEAREPQLSPADVDFFDRLEAQIAYEKLGIDDEAFLGANGTSPGTASVDETLSAEVVAALPEMELAANELPC